MANGSLTLNSTSGGQTLAFTVLSGNASFQVSYTNSNCECFLFTLVFARFDL